MASDLLLAAEVEGEEIGAVAPAPVVPVGIVTEMTTRRGIEMKGITSTAGGSGRMMKRRGTGTTMTRGGGVAGVLRGAGAAGAGARAGIGKTEISKRKLAHLLKKGMWMLNLRKIRP